jgi:uncharacterized protein (TIGR03067 family)
MRCTLPLLAILCLAFAPAPFPRINRTDIQKLQGEWKVISEAFEGRMRPHRVSAIRFAGHSLSEASGGGRCDVILDESRCPKGMEMVYGAKLAEPVRLCAVYTLQGDVLRICYYSIQEGRPRDLSGKGTMQYLSVYRRSRR